MARTVVGLDIGVRSIRGTVLTTSFRDREISGHFAHEVSPDAEAENPEEGLWAGWRAAIEELMENGSIPPGSIICAALPDAWASTRLLEMPFGDAKKVDAALEGELEFQQTILDIDNLATTWAKAGPLQLGPSQQIVAATCPRQRLTRLLQLLTELGCEPHHLVHPAGAYFNLLDLRQRQKSKSSSKKTEPSEAASQTGPTELSGEDTEQAQEPVPTHDPFAGLRLLVDIGATRTNLCAMESTGRLLFARTINWGTDHCDQVISSQLGIPEEDAAELRATEGRIYTGFVSPPSGEHSQLHQALVTAHLPLIQQLRVTCNMVRRDPEDHTEIWLSGGGGRLRGLERHLSQELGIDARRKENWTLLEGLVEGAASIEDESQLLSACLALGAARGRRGIVLDFRRGELAHAGELSWVRGLAIKAAVGMVAVVLFALTGLIVQYNVSADMEKALDQRIAEISQRTLHKKLSDPRVVIAEMQNPGGPTGSSIPRYDAVDLFLLLSTSIPSEIEVVFSDLEMRLDRIIIKGTCKDFETLEQLAEKLKTLPCVNDVRQTRSSRTSDDKIKFGITIKVECAEGETPIPEEKS